MDTDMNQLIDEDGKIKISDGMSDDLKSAIKFLNENNIGLFDEIDDSDALNEEEENEESSVSLFHNGAGIPGMPSGVSDDTPSEPVVQEDDLKEDGDESDLDDLNSMF